MRGALGGWRAAEWNPPRRHSPITDYRLPTTDYRLPTTDYWKPRL
jgi:hypothetical protein